MSYADKWTDEQLEELEKKISEVYSDAQKELEKTAKDYFEKFAERDEEERAKLESGKITKQQYKQWRLAQMGRGERFNKLAEEMAHRATATNEVAVAYVNDVTPSIYTLNRNHEAYMIEKLGYDMKIGQDFTLINEQTIKRMIVENPDIMPYYPPARAVKRGIDLEYGQKYIKKHVTSGILQGKGVGKIADDLQRDLTNMNRASALRTARTAVTSAQNGGRQATMERAVEMGIPIQKKWKCVHDIRTRHEHGAADGQTVPVNEPFIVGGEKLMHPGDPSGSGWNIYNCRCVEGSVEKEGIVAEKRQMRARNPETGRNELVEDMTYEEWAKARGLKPNKTKAKTVVQEKTKFVPAKTKAEAEAFSKSVGIDADYSKYDISVANAINETMEEYVNIFGEHAFDNLDKISSFVKGEKTHEWGGYNSKEKSIKIRGVSSKDAIEKTGKTMQKYAEGYFSTGSNLHIIRHELGHSVHDVVDGSVSSELKKYRRNVRENVYSEISFRAGQDEYEFVAECLAQYLNGNPSKIAIDVVEILKKGFKYKFG